MSLRLTFHKLILILFRRCAADALVNSLPKALGRSPETLASALCSLTDPFSRTTDRGSKTAYDVANCLRRALESLSYRLAEAAPDGC